MAVAAWALLFALAGGEIQMVAAAGVLDSDADGLEREASVAGAFVVDGVAWRPTIAFNASTRF